MKFEIADKSYSISGFPDTSYIFQKKKLPELWTDSFVEKWLSYEKNKPKPLLLMRFTSNDLKTNIDIALSFPKEVTLSDEYILSLNGKQLNSLQNGNYDPKTYKQLVPQFKVNFISVDSTRRDEWFPYIKENDGYLKIKDIKKAGELYEITGDFRSHLERANDRTIIEGTFKSKFWKASETSIFDIMDNH